MSLLLHINSVAPGLLFTSAQLIYPYVFEKTFHQETEKRGIEYLGQYMGGQFRRCAHAKINDSEIAIIERLRKKVDLEVYNKAYRVGTTITMTPSTQVEGKIAAAQKAATNKVLGLHAP